MTKAATHAAPARPDAHSSAPGSCCQAPHRAESWTRRLEIPFPRCSSPASSSSALDDFSGTSGSPSILNASPEAAVGSGLAVLRSGDRVRVDLRKGQVNVLLSAEEIVTRQQELNASGGYQFPESQTPWQEMQRAAIGQFEGGAVLEAAVKYQRIARSKGIPRHNH